MSEYMTSNIDYINEYGYEEENEHYEEEDVSPAWNERYLNTLGMSMKDFM